MILKALLALTGVSLAAVLVLGLLLRHERQQAAQARSERDAAVAQADLNAKTGEVIERTLTREITIIRQAEESADAVQALPGADAPLDPAFTAGLRARLDGMRSQAGTVGSDHPGNPARTLSPPDP